MSDDATPDDVGSLRRAAKRLRQAQDSAYLEGDTDANALLNCAAVMLETKAELLSERAARVAAEADAERYRWLRDNSLLDGHVTSYEIEHDLDESDSSMPVYSERCDAAIDALTAAQVQK